MAGALDRLKAVLRDDAREAGGGEWKFLLVVFLVACAVVALRRPDAITNPQFYLEDGSLWYAEAHDLGGLRSTLMPSHRGYFHTAERLGAWAGLAVPLAWAPLVFVLIAIAAEALPAVLLASRRYARVAPDRRARLGLAALTLAVPSIWGTISNLTHTQWHLAVLACLVVLAAPAVGRAWRAFDVAVVALSGLTGPTCLLLAPIAAVVWVVRRDRWALALTAIVGATACVQATSLALTAAPVEAHAPLGASVGMFLRLVAQRVVYAAVLGQRVSAALLGVDGGGGAALGSTAAVAVAALVGLAALGYAVARGPVELKLFLAFAAGVLCLALLWPLPMNSVENGYWAMLAAPGAHCRYFYPLTLGLVATFVWLLSRTSVPERAVGGVGLAAAVLCAIPLDFREPAYRDYRFRDYAAKYERAAPGERVQIPVPPGWSMLITKR